MLADAVPLYPLYALLFADTGLSAAEISALFALWSFMGVVAEVPSGALADRFGRRAAVVLAGVLQAAGYAMWIALPGFPGFAAGFALWGLGGAMASGAFEALLYDGLAAAGEADRYARVLGRVEAAALAVQVPIAGAATALFAAGGYTLAGVVSVATSLGAAAVAATLPDVRPEREEDEDDLGYLATLRAGVAEAAGSPPVRAAVLAVAGLTAFDGLEEYFPLLAADWGVPTEAIPLALVAVPLAGALGAALAGAGRAPELRRDDPDAAGRRRRPGRGRPGRAPGRPGRRHRLLRPVPPGDRDRRRAPAAADRRAGARDGHLGRRPGDRRRGDGAVRRLGGRRAGAGDRAGRSWRPWPCHAGWGRRGAHECEPATRGGG